MKQLFARFLLATLFVAAGQALAAEAPSVPGHNAAVRLLKDVMSKPPYLDSKTYRAWVVEKSDDFQVVLIEVFGTIPLHMHPDGNRRMFLIEGEMTMLGGEHEIAMKPGDYMYLPRNHHHKVWMSTNQKHALFMLVDNPPALTANIVWIEPAPELIKNPEQPKSALIVQDHCEAGQVTKPK